MREDRPDTPHSTDADSVDDPSRRVFVQRLTFFGGGVVLLGSACPDRSARPAAPDAAAPVALTTSHRTFTDPEWQTLVAAVDRVLPRDEDPGAVDAGVPDYIDAILQTPQLTQMRESFIPGLAALDRRARRMYGTPFHEATEAQRDELLTIFKNSPERSGEARWYEMLVVLTMEGFLGDPSYGGNKGEVGWNLVGFTLVGRNIAGDPRPGYDGRKTLDRLTCGGGKGC